MRSGSLYARPTWERRTGESDASCWPTARSTDGPKGGPGQVNGKGVADSLPGVTALWPTPSASNPNDTEDTEAWRARQAKLKAKHGNNGAGEPPAIVAREIVKAPGETISVPAPTWSDLNGDTAASYSWAAATGLTIASGGPSATVGNSGGTAGMDYALTCTMTPAPAVNLLLAYRQALAFPGRPAARDGVVGGAVSARAALVGQVDDGWLLNNRRAIEQIFSIPIRQLGRDALVVNAVLDEQDGAIGRLGRQDALGNNLALLIDCGLTVVPVVDIIEDHQIGAQLVELHTAHADIKANCQHIKAVRGAQHLARPALGIPILVHRAVDAQLLKQSRDRLQVSVRRVLGLTDIESEPARLLAANPRAAELGRG